MRSVAMALTWEFWHRGWVWILIAPAALACPLLLVYTLLGYEGNVSFRGTRIGWGLHWDFYLCALLYFPTTLLWLQQRFTRRFPLPLTTYSLVGWSMANTALAAAFMYCAMAGLLNVMCDAGWPWLAPALFAATTAVCVQAAIWSLSDSRFLQSLACLSAVAVLFWWLAARYGVDFSTSPTRMWTSITLGEALTMSGLVAGAYAFAVVGVRRLRCGNGWNIQSLARRLAELLERPFRSASSPFLTRSAAQGWFEWRRRGMAYPAFVLALSVIVFVWCASPYRDARDIVDLLGGLSVVAILGSGLVGVYVGHRSAAWELGSYNATRPVPSSDLARAVLFNTVATTLVAAAIWGLTTLLAIGFFALLGHGGVVINELYLATAPRGTHEFVPLLTVGALLLAAWTAVALGASLALARGWFIVSAVYLGALGFIGAMLLFNFAVPDPLKPLAEVLIVAVVGTSFFLATATLFVAARRQQLFGKATTWISAVWVTLCAIGLIMTPMTSADQWHEMLLALGLLSLPCTPFAAAPLALSWNRHR